MAESKIQNSFSRTTILTVGRLLLFIAVGFAIGLVVGVASEEPTLLAGHLRGDSATIELDGRLSERVEESEVAALALAEREQSEAERVGEAADEARAEEAEQAAPLVYSAQVEQHGEGAVSSDALPDVAAPPPGGVGAGGAERWAIQVGAFGDEPSASRLVEQLEAKGYPVAVLPAGPESNRWRVRVQPLASETTARATAARIEREERLPIWVIRLEGSASQ